MQDAIQKAISLEPEEWLDLQVVIENEIACLQKRLYELEEETEHDKQRIQQYSHILSAITD